ncbi:MAG: TonB-dependent receptor [Bryobacterales bacterium]|nr:TonB-dependent receptor [Bryobacterales bacterium]
MKRFIYIALFVSGHLSAQSDRASITGTVTDPTGAAVPAATVVATNVSTNGKVETLTSGDGVYTIPYLSLGTYRVSVEAAGFKRAAKTDLVLTGGSTVRADLKLEIGAVTEQVEVKAAAPQLRQDSAEISQQVSSDTILSLPLGQTNAGRNILSFAFLTPGANGDTFDNFKVGGGSSNGVEYVIDGLGASNNTRNLNLEGPGPDSISEFKVITNSFDAEYGHTTGALITFVTKSGTNTVHGNIFHFLRNNEMDARGAVLAAPTVNRQNDFGATIGGPVSIPKLYKGRDRTFFFGGFEGFTFRGGAPSSFQTLPTAAMQQGDFSKYVNAQNALIPIYDPATTRASGSTLVRDAFPGNVIPQNRISSVAKNLVGVFPALTFPDRLVNNILSSGTVVRNIYQSNGRLDHSITAKDKIGGSFSQRYRRTDPKRLNGPLPYPLSSQFTGDNQDTYFVRVSYDRIWTPSVVSQIRVGYNRNHLFERAITHGEDWSGKLGIPNLAKVNFPIFTLAEYPQLGAEKDYHKFEDTKQIAGSVAWVTGKHSLKFGAEYRDKKMYARLFNDVVGTFAFRPTETGSPTLGGGNSFASLLLGLVDNGFFRPQPYSVTGYKTPYGSMFVQDNWKVTRKLTVNIGLRWEVSLPMTETHGRMSFIDLATPNPGAANRPGALVFYGSGPGQLGTNTIWDTSWKQFGPRLGIAYSLTQKTVIRTGYGLFFEPNNVNGLSNISANGFFGLAQYVSPDNGLTQAFQLDGGFPQNYLRAPSIDPTFINGLSGSTRFASDGAPGYVNQWNFGIQRQIGGTLLLDATYAGSAAAKTISGYHAYNQVPARYLPLGPVLQQNINSDAARAAGIAAPYAGFTGTVAQALRPFPQYQSIGQFYEKDGHTSYHSLQVKVEKRYSAGLTLLGAFTWSKNLVNADYPLNGGNSLFSLAAPQDAADYRTLKSLSPNDVPKRLVVSYIYELPFGKGKRFAMSGVANLLLGGWQVSGIYSYQNATPLAFTTTLANPLFGGAIRPNVSNGVPFRAAIAGNSFDPFKDAYISPGFMTLPAAFTFGNAALRYNYRAFAQLNEDMTLVKSFRIKERFRTELRWEAFNVLNRVIWGGPATNVSAANFGRVSGQGNAPRIMQVGVKVTY